MIRPQLLLVEDEPSLAQMLSYNLDKAGFEVHVAADGEEALLLLAEAKPDLVVLDWMLPGVSGLEICRQLRRRGDTGNLPIIMLTARGEETDKLRGLETGADDYITKPFSPMELVARIRSILRRSRPATANEVLQFADLRMDLAAYRVSRDGVDVHLGPTEFRLLRHFLESPGRVYSREQILDAVWGPDSYLEPRTVDVHIRRLRKALNATDGADLIRTVRGAGYALDRPEADSTAIGAT
jgi:two-component system, OmpR family, phosphate regulon response regulator PhoB